MNQKFKTSVKKHSETTDPKKEGIANEHIFILIGKNRRQSSFIKYFLCVIQRQDLRSKTLRSKITFEHMIRPFKWFLWMKVAQPVRNVEKTERHREQDTRHGIDFARAISRSLTSGFQQTGPSIFLQAYKNRECQTFKEFG